MLLNCGVGEDSWESLGLQGDKSVHPKGNQSWIFIEMTDAEAPILWPLDAKNGLIWKDPDAGKDWMQDEKGTTYLKTCPTSFPGAQSASVSSGTPSGHVEGQHLQQQWIQSQQRQMVKALGKHQIVAASVISPAVTPPWEDLWRSSLWTVQKVLWSSTENAAWGAVESPEAWSWVSLLGELHMPLLGWITIPALALKLLNPRKLPSSEHIRTNVIKPPKVLPRRISSPGH